MEKINFQYSDQLVNELVRLENIRTQIKLMDLTEKDRDDLEVKVKVTNIFHLAHMIGVELTLKDAQKAIEGKRVITQDARGVILNNFKNVLDFTRAEQNSSSTSTELDLNILTHLNRVLLNEWKESWDIKLRTSGEKNDATLDNWLSIIDSEIEPSHIQDEILSLFEWYKSKNTQTHIVIRIGVLLYALVRIAPFVNLNKLTLLALADYLFQKNGYSSETFMPVIRNFDLHDSEYTEAWSFAVQNENSIKLWLERFVTNITNDLEIVKDELDKLYHREEKGNTARKSFLDLNKRQMKILRYLQTIPTVKREDYVQMMDVSTMTAFRDLIDLLNKKLLKIEGKGRGTKYMLTNR